MPFVRNLKTIGLVVAGLVFCLTACTSPTEKSVLSPSPEGKNTTLSTKKEESTIETDSTAEPANEVDEVDDICTLSVDRVGETVRISGEIVFVNENDPMGRFMEVADGCQVGVFAQSRLLESWEQSVNELLVVGNWVEVEGELVTFDNNLIVDIRNDPPVAAESSYQPEISEEFTGGESESGLERLGYGTAPASHQLEVDHIYSGIQGYPALCYLGAFAMSVHHENPEISFDDIVAMSGVGSAAAVVQSPGTQSGRVLTNGVWEASIGLVSQQLKAELIIGSAADGSLSDPNNPLDLHLINLASDIWQFTNQEEAFDTLRRVVAAGHAVTVHLNTKYVADDFAQQTDEWTGRSDQASHYMTVTGYDETSVYLHDPTEVESEGTNLSAPVDHFLEAWYKTTQGQNMPPVGPLWMAFLASPGEYPEPQAVAAWNASFSTEAPNAFRQFAENPGSDQFTCFSQGELARGRMVLSSYLESAGLTEPAAFYRQSSELLAQGGMSGGANASQLEQIATLEEQALTAMSP